ncbi:hypothetical protein SDJN02_16046, partial [Cucurbita argyrosperma subsp. argyrosperma]
MMKIWHQDHRVPQTMTCFFQVLLSSYLYPGKNAISSRSQVVRFGHFCIKLAFRTNVAGGRKVKKKNGSIQNDNKNSSRFDSPCHAVLSLLSGKVL